MRAQTLAVRWVGAALAVITAAGILVRAARLPYEPHLGLSERRTAGHPNAGKPCIVLHGVLKQWFDSQGLRVHVSVTDESEYAASFCVVETGDWRCWRD